MSDRLHNVRKAIKQQILDLSQDEGEAAKYIRAGLQLALNTVNEELDAMEFGVIPRKVVSPSGVIGYPVEDTPLPVRLG